VLHKIAKHSIYPSSFPLIEENRQPVLLHAEASRVPFDDMGANRRQSFGEPKRRESYGWKLFHRKERPALERSIIDTSEWARANYRYVMKQHLDLFKRYTSGLSELAARCGYLSAVYRAKYQWFP
jgi:hypothetical protein